jgi:exonuclease VII large subunit
MEELGSQLEAQNKSLEEKRDAEEQLRRQMSELLEKEEQLQKSWSEREKEYQEQLERIGRESRARFEELEARVKADTQKQIEEIERARDAAVATSAADSSEREAAERKLAEVQAKFEQWKRQVAEASKLEALAVKESVVKNFSDTLNSELECPICQEIFVRVRRRC